MEMFQLHEQQQRQYEQQQRQYEQQQLAMEELRLTRQRIASEMHLSFEEHAKCTLCTLM